jgi:UDP-N-acetylglucosamine acyltransferase
LRRRGYDPETIRQIQEVYRIIFLSPRNTTQALQYLETHFPATSIRDEIIQFVRFSERGIMKAYYRNNDA